MVSPSRLDAARKVPDRKSRIRTMAEVMRDSAAAYGACETQHLRAAGFTQAEIFAYADDARAILSGRPRVALISPARREGLALIREAQRIRKRLAQHEEAL